MHFKRIIKIFKYLIFSFGILFLIILAGVNLPFSQRIITQRVNGFLDKKHLPAQVDRITLLINGKIGLTGARVIKVTGDTVVFAQKLRISVRILPILFRKVKVKSISLNDAIIHITSDPVTGKPDLMSLFSNDTEAVKEMKRPGKSGKKWDISVNSMTLRNILFTYNDKLNGIQINQAVGKMDVGFDTFSLINRQIYVTSVDLVKAHGKLVLKKPHNPKSNEKKSPGGWNFKLMKSSLTGLLFILDRPDENKQYRFSLDNGEFSRVGFDMSGSRISVARLMLHKPFILLYSSRADLKPEAGSKVTGGIDFPGQWNIAGDNLKINDGTFQTKRYDIESPLNDVDSAILISRFNTTLKDVRLSNLESRFIMSRLSFELDNGLKLDKGEISFSSDSTGKSLLGATLMTPSSRINLSVEAGSELSELISSWQSVPFSMKIKDTEISARDIFAFFPHLKERSSLGAQENFRLGIDCNVEGKAGQFKIGSLTLRAGSGVTLSAYGQLSNITDPASASCSLDFGFGPVTHSKLVELINLTGRSLKLPEFEPITLKGTITDSLSKPNFLLKLQSMSGNISIGGSISLPDKRYKLKVAYSGLEIGKLSGIKDLDRVTGSIDLAGIEFLPDSMKIKASVKIDSAGFRGYIYQGISAELDGDHGLYNFGLNSSDSSFKCDLAGSFTQSDTMNIAEISGILDLDAGKINLVKDIRASGAVKGDFYQSPGNLNASLSLKNLVLKTTDNTEDLENLSVSFQSSDTIINGKIESDFLNATFNSAGSVAELKEIFKEGRLGIATVMDSAAGSRMPYISALPETSFSVESTYDPVIGLFLKDSIFSYNGVSIELAKDNTGFARAEVFVDRINYGANKGFGVTIKIGNPPGKSFIQLEADSIVYNKIKLTGIESDISTEGGTVTARLKASDKESHSLYDISAEARKSEGQIKLRSTQPLWTLNGFSWDVKAGDFLIIDPKFSDLTADLHWKNDQHSIDIYGQKSQKINLELKNVGLKMLIFPGINTFGYDGELTGKIDYKSHDKNELNIQMNIEQFKMADNPLGTLNITGSYISDTLGTKESNVRVVMNDTSMFNFSLMYGKDKNQKRIDTDFSGIPLKTFETFVNKYISGLHGEISGTLSVTGKESNSRLNGELKIDNIGLRVVPLNALFFIPDEVIKLENNYLIFNQFTVMDSLKKRLRLNGNIDLNNPENITADLKVTSDLLQVMNTSSKDNPVFFGSVFVNSNLNLTGPVQKPAIKGNIVLAEGTVVNYQYAENLSVSETQKIITFARFREDNNTVISKQVTGSLSSKSPYIETSIEIDPSSLFNFQISRGFEIGARITGGGFLTYSLMPNGEMDLAGTYQIKQGNSELKIPGWPRKDFIITPGSNLKWNGKVDDPELQVETTSKVRGSYVNPVDGKTREVNFLVYMKLAGKLSQLEIIFDVRSEDQYITSVLNSLSKEERMRQAINLLVFGSIELPNLSSSSNYMTQQINQFWESQLNQITKSVIKKVDVSFGIDTYTGASESGGEATYTSLSYQIKKKMFRDRGSVLVSGHMNDNSPASQQSNTVIENFIFEYALDTNQTKFLKVYRQQNYEDLLEGEVTKSGVGFIYRKNYQKLSDIWRRQRKGKNK
jgi:translocation and assembly module TamB